MAQVVKVRGVDAAALKAVRAGEDGLPLLSWEQDLGNRYGSARIGLAEDIDFRPGEDDFVEITRSDGVTREFSGLVVVPQSTDLPGQRDYSHDVEAVGMGALLDRIRVSATLNWPAGTPDSKMVADLLAQDWGALRSDATHVIRSRRVDMPAMTVEAGVSLRAGLDDIAREAWDAPWWPDADGNCRWNDHPLSSLILWAPADGGAQRAFDDATFAPFEELTDMRAGRSKALRVRVVGNGVEATITDGQTFVRVSKRKVDEPWPSTDRFWDLPDVVDTSLTTVTQCERRGWAEIAAHAASRTWRVATTREGFAVGQLVDVVDEQMGTLAVPYPRRRMRTPSYSGNGLHKGQGRWQIVRILAEAQGGGEWRYTLELGNYAKTFGVGLTRAA